MGTYWTHDGKHQAIVEQLDDLIPSEGRAQSLTLDLFRNAANLYHDLYNNGGCNFDVHADQWGHLWYYADLLIGDEISSTEMYRINDIVHSHQWFPDDVLEILFGLFEKLVNAVVVVAWKNAQPVTVH